MTPTTTFSMTITMMDEVCLYILDAITSSKEERREHKRAMGRALIQLGSVFVATANPDVKYSDQEPVRRLAENFISRLDSMIAFNKETN